MANATPPSMPPLWRQILYLTLICQVAVLANVAADMWSQVPDAYTHQHLGLLLGTLGSALLILSVLSHRASIRFWLLGLACALIATNLLTILLR